MLTVTSVLFHCAAFAVGETEAVIAGWAVAGVAAATLKTSARGPVHVKYL